MTDYAELQKRCQRGASNINDANNLLAECYGMLGKLGAENNALRTGLGEAKYRIEQGRIWNGMGWTLTGLNSHCQQQALAVIDSAMSNQD